ncbi:MAG: InlB B-repeat-containing protein [Flavobacteriaceae bacterium]
MRLYLITLLWIFVFSCSKGDSESPNQIEPTPVVTYDVSISSSEGGSVNTKSGTYNAGTVLTITATPNDGYEFISWTGSNETSMEIMIVVNSNIQLTANFQLILIPEFTVTTIAGEGGLVSQGGTFPSGSVFSVVATPSEGYKFTGWTGSSETSNVLTITISSDINLTANFSKIFSYNSEEYSYVELSEPPYGGTIFVTGNIITSTDKSVYDSLVYKGTDRRTMYDFRNGGAFIEHDPFLYDAYFSDGLVTEIQINSEFSVDQSLLEAEKYGFSLGQLSKGLRKHVETMWIHKGTESYGGGNNNILVHTGMSKIYESYYTGNIIEETLLHEATHTSVDAYVYPDRLTNGEEWIKAVDKDNCYISDYARDYPYREDLAELMPLYIAVKFFPDRISEDVRNKILSCCINRILYLDSLSLDLDIYKD